MQSTGLQTSSDDGHEFRQPLIQKSLNRPKQYQRVDLNLRKKIIDQVLNKGTPLREIAINLGIKYSTAKAIVQVYQNQGRIGKKNTRDKRIFNQMESYIIIVNKQTGKVDKLKILSESNDLMTNMKEDKKRLEEEHFSKLTQALSNYGFDPNYSRQNLPENLNKIVDQLMNQHTLIKKM